ncbi:DUF4123 domain-containing protein [Stenotrophomonas sp. RAC2]|uniref:DUF4123 domain-containing protein n=1 Tax=Stenotrophomonas sp. RAC2 TaxID=3064902 RepID=UPI0027262DFA|nr:DUF4123 domain-containing protein [Stenotrophomonas sp. RAC2]MDV9042025.1 DUF4123 domain-containing protein [Stenotrophomonas sp. RAC2]
MYTYLIVDCAVRPDAARTLRFYAQDLLHRSLFHGQPEAKHADVGPWLVKLDGVTVLDGWLNALERTGNCVPCVSHLKSNRDFETVFAHLQSFLDLHLSDGSRALFRFWDPRVFTRLQRVLTREQLQGLMAPFSEWCTTKGILKNAY